MKARAAHVALQDHQLVAKRHDLDVAPEIIGGAGEEPDEAAQQQITRGQRARTEPPGERGAILRTAAQDTISGLCVLPPQAHNLLGGFEYFLPREETAVRTT